MDGWRYTSSSPGVSLVWVLVETPKAARGTIVISYKPDTAISPAVISVTEGGSVSAKVDGESINGWHDPQGLLSNAKVEAGTLKGTASASPGPGVLFASVGSQSCKRWVPVSA